MQLIEKFADQISAHRCTDDIKPEELEKECKKIHKIWARMVVACQDAPGVVPSNVKRSDPANSAASRRPCSNTVI